jgi:hypothetical protein
MQYIVPTIITDAMLVSSSVAETDYAAWSAATAYTLGQRVIRTATHSIYERLVAGTTATAPEADLVNWARVGPTNRWAMLDGAVGTATSDTGPITITLAPGLVRGMALLDLDVEAVAVEMTVGAVVVYARTFNAIASGDDVDNWFDFFFDAIERRRTVVVTDLPPFGEAEITVTLTGSGTISVGSLILGVVYDLGATQSGATVGIVDYSRKEADEFGAVVVAERAYAKRMTLPLILDTVRVDIATARLARIRARPVVWIGSDVLDSLVVYGWVKDWSIDIPGMTLSSCSLEIEGLV